MLLDYAGLFLIHKMAAAVVRVVENNLGLQHAGRCSLIPENKREGDIK